MTQQVKTVLVAAVSLTALAGLGGCSWFGHGGEDLNAGKRFQPPPVAPVYVSPEAPPVSGYLPPTQAARHEETTIGTITQGGPGSIPTAEPLKPREQVKGAPPPTPATTPPSTTEPVIPQTIKDHVGSAAPIQEVTPLPRETVAVVTPTTRRAATGGAGGTGRSMGSFLTLGGVVAEVNQRPIYANQVLREIVGPLSARAKELSEEQFRGEAYKLIESQIQRLANAERETAVAERNLDEKEKETARMAAARWRQRQITENGGSLEMAKRKWAAEGYDFEDRVDKQYRDILAQLYYSKKVWPRVQVTADEIRQYYNQHVNDEFTERDQVRFRVIKIDPRRTGGREAALNKITDLRARAVRGEDFAEMASTVNDDKFLMSKGGDVGWIRKGDYANEQVEKAAWDLQPGSVSDIIDAGGAFYIAKVEERKLGRVMPFDEQAVQDTIVRQLKADQFKQLRDKVLATLAKNSVIRTDKDMVNSAVDMAVQNYPLWHSGAGNVE